MCLIFIIAITIIAAIVIVISKRPVRGSRALYGSRGHGVLATEMLIQRCNGSGYQRETHKAVSSFWVMQVGKSKLER